MPRRRLRLSYSDEEDEGDVGNNVLEVEDEPPVIVSNQSVILNPSNPHHAQYEPVEISDDDLEEYMDVSDNLPDPSPPSDLPPPVESFQQIPVVAPSNSGEGIGCLIDDFLGRLGLRLKREWVDTCISGLESSIPGFSLLDVSAKAKLCFERFLVSDMNYCGAGVLPQNVDSMHAVDLPGPYVLQVDEIINISCPLKGRYQKAPPEIKRCLKLSMTDGTGRVFGMEYRPIKALEVLAHAGQKVVISNVHVRRGILMLVPETLEVLGGSVDELEAARMRLVEEVNQPPRGRRTRDGNLPSLAARATRAAWSSNGVDVSRQSDSTLLSPNSFQLSGQGTALNQTVTNNRIPENNNGGISVTVENDALNSSLDLMSEVEAMRIDTNRDTLPGTRGKPVARHSCSTVPTTNEMHVSTTHTISMDSMPSHVIANSEETHAIRMDSMTCPVLANHEGDYVDCSPTTNSSVRGQPSSAAPNAGNMHTDDATVNHLIHSQESEIPFTYLASLSVKWATIKDERPFVRGKVKCFLTGVKGFQYKRRTTYELRVYVDDGSLISEILIDHNVVRKGIGYSPIEVTAALSSSDANIVTSMKETMRQFQVFLANFEGIMLIEINGETLVPIALEMNPCLQSDAWLLLRRLKTFHFVNSRMHKNPDPIDLSP